MTPEDNRKEVNSTEWRKIGIAFSASWIVVASIGICVLAGLGLDRLFHTGKLFLIIMFVFGIAAGLYNLVRELNRIR